MLLSAVKLLLVVISLATAQAPGDEDDRCTVDHTSPQVYPDNVKTLMDSFNYDKLLPGNGTGDRLIGNAVWNDRSYDGNDVTSRSHPTYVRNICSLIFLHVCAMLFAMAVVSNGHVLINHYSGSRVMLEEYVSVTHGCVDFEKVPLRTTGSSLNTSTNRSTHLWTITQFRSAPPSNMPLAVVERDTGACRSSRSTCTRQTHKDCQVLRGKVS